MAGKPKVRLEFEIIRGKPVAVLDDPAVIPKVGDEVVFADKDNVAGRYQVTSRSIDYTGTLTTITLQVD